MELLAQSRVAPAGRLVPVKASITPVLPSIGKPRKATCPQGKISRKWTLKQDRTVSGVIRIQFGKHDCLACPCRSQCTTAGTNPRQLVVRPQAQFEAIQASRQRQQTQELKSVMPSERALKGPFPKAFESLTYGKVATSGWQRRIYSM